MISERLVDFYNFIGRFDDYSYLLAVLKIQAAPTSFGMKPATLVNIKDNSRKLTRLWHIHKNDIQIALSLSSYEIKVHENSVLVYFYDEKLLYELLIREDIKKYLNSVGYGQCLEIEDYLLKLKYNFSNCCPHEVGVFLGYPLEDVVDFTNCSCKKLKCTGYWKCYNNPMLAKKIFKSFDEAKIVQMDRILNLNPM